MVKLNSCRTVQYKQMETDHNKSDLIFLFDKKEKICYIYSRCAFPFDPQIEKKEKDQVKNYTDLKYDILKMWKKRSLRLTLFQL